MKRYKERGVLIPEPQQKLYEKIRDFWIGGRTVIDVGCSLGIGSNIMSHSARAVWGVDVNAEAIDFASKTFRRPNLDFAVLDLENPPTRELAKFEVVVMSEVIEHLVDPEAGLNTIKRFFSQKGGTIGFITAPNYANEVSRENEAKHGFHLSHFTAGEFYELLTRHFQSVTMYSVDKLNQWNQEETVDGDSKDYLIVAKVEGLK
jgi:2-polyprenyl-3-methyl-5-hydroxy-6-metoxy-1,4-benzoquinol methylase